MSLTTAGEKTAGEGRQTEPGIGQTHAPPLAHTHTGTLGKSSMIAGRGRCLLCIEYLNVSETACCKDKGCRDGSVTLSQDWTLLNARASARWVAGRNRHRHFLSQSLSRQLKLSLGPILPLVLIFCSSLLLSLKHTHPSTSSHTHTKSTIQRKRAPTAGQTMVWSTTEDLGPKQTRKTPTPAKIEHLFKFRAPSVRVQHVRGCFWHQGGNYPDPTRVSSPPLPFKCSRVGVLK